MFWKKEEASLDKVPAINNEVKPAVCEGIKPSPEPLKAPKSVSESVVDRYGKARSALGPGTVIQGKLSFDTPVRIDGKLSGEVFSSDVLIVGNSGSVEANLECSVLVVMGKVKGNVKAHQRLEIVAGGEIEGEFYSPVLVVDNGAKINATCSMTDPQKVLSVGKDKSQSRAEPQTQILEVDPASLNQALENVVSTASEAEAKVSPELPVH